MDVGETQKREARLRAIVDSAVDGIITIDERGQVETMNPAAERMFGYAAEEVVGSSVAMLMTEPDASRHDGYIQSYRGGGQAKIIGIGRDVTGLRKDGTTFPLHLSVGEARFPGGRLFTGILRDLTRVKQLEREFLQAQKMEAVGRLASGIAHDFNNLLMGISGCADMALEHLPPDHAACSYIDDLRRASRRGGALVRRLLSFSRRPPEETQACDLVDLVFELGPMLERLIGENITLTRELPQQPVWVRCGAGQVEQVLLNLVVNARHAMSDGGRLDLEVNVDDPMAVLVVRDTGCGMDEETRSHAFEPFFTTRGEGEGTGLGLSTVYGIVDRVGGSIAVESEIGKGSCFRIRFPTCPAPSGSPAESRPKPRQTAATVLIVEDDTLVRMTLRHYLEKHGFTVSEAADGETALDLLQQPGCPVTVLVTDMILPGMTGAELASKSAENQLATVYMSAHDPEYLRAEGKIQDGDITINKPFSEGELLQAIERARALRSRQG